MVSHAPREPSIKEDEDEPNNVDPTAINNSTLLNTSINAATTTDPHVDTTTNSAPETIKADLEKNHNSLEQEFARLSLHQSPSMPPNSNEFIFGELKTALRI